MAHAYHGQRLGTLLQQAGILPPHARLVELVAPADGAVVMRFEVFVSRDDLPKLAAALTALAEEA